MQVFSLYRKLYNYIAGTIATEAAIWQAKSIYRLPQLGGPQGVVTTNTSIEPFVTRMKVFDRQKYA